MSKTTDADDDNRFKGICFYRQDELSGMIVKDVMIDVERCYTPFTKVELHVPRLIDYLKFDGVFSIKIMT